MKRHLFSMLFRRRCHGVVEHEKVANFMAQQEQVTANLAVTEIRKLKHHYSNGATLRIHMASGGGHARPTK